MNDHFRIRDLTSTGAVFTPENEHDEAVLRPLLKLVRVLCDRNVFSEDYPVEVILTITRVPRVGGGKITPAPRAGRG